MTWSTCLAHLVEILPDIAWPPIAPPGWESDNLQPPELAADLALARLVPHQEKARAEVQSRLERGLRGWMRSTNYPDALRDDAQQFVTWEVLGERPKLDEYLAKGSLNRWLAVTGARLALSFRRRELRALNLVPLPERDQPWALLVTSTPELKVLRQDTLDRFKVALGAALANLSARDRALISMRYIDGAEVDALATIYRVHRVTMSRWLGDARDQLRADVLSRFGTIGDGERGELRGWLGSQPDLSLGRLLVAAED